MYARRWLCSRVVSLSITTICMVINTLYPWTLIEDQSIRRIARPAIVNDCHLQLISDIIHSADRLQAGSDDITNVCDYNDGQCRHSSIEGQDREGNAPAHGLTTLLDEPSGRQVNIQSTARLRNPTTPACVAVKT